MKRQIGDLLEKTLTQIKNKALWKDFLGGMGFFFKRGNFFLFVQEKFTFGNALLFPDLSQKGRMHCFMSKNLST